MNDGNGGDKCRIDVGPREVQKYLLDWKAVRYDLWGQILIMISLTSGEKLEAWGANENSCSWGQNNFSPTLRKKCSTVLVNIDLGGQECKNHDLLKNPHCIII